MWYAILYHVTW